MAIRPIIIAPDPVLKAKAKPVENIDGGIVRLMDDMLETMYRAPGIGLAAPQIGILQRVIVVDVADKDEKPQPFAMANPEILWKSDETSVHNEGCLSLPDHYADVTRPKQVRLRYVDRDGEVRELDADNLLATCVQHEIDHLNGRLFVDYLSEAKRQRIRKRLEKERRQQAVPEAVGS
jgi:peptide deformylase